MSEDRQKLMLMAMAAGGPGVSAAKPLDAAMQNVERSLGVIAAEIRRDWKNPYFGAVPYLDALSGLDKITDMYGADDGKSMVLYFLANAQTWRGETARRVKAELKRMAQARG